MPAPILMHPVFKLWPKWSETAQQLKTEVLLHCLCYDCLGLQFCSPCYAQKSVWPNFSFGALFWGYGVPQMDKIYFCLLVFPNFRSRITFCLHSLGDLGHFCTVENSSKGGTRVFYPAAANQIITLTVVGHYLRP